MIVGILKEIKTKESRVAMTPAGVEQLVGRGLTVCVETHAGEESGFADPMYEKAGAAILSKAREVYAKCAMVMKVKEPQPVEYPLIRKGQVVFTYFHFAASEELTRAIIASGCTAVAYETVKKANGSLPLLTPMSEVAGKMAVHAGAKYLEKTYGGKGKLLGGVPGVDVGTVLILGGGVVGVNAAKIACGLGARVYLLDTNLERLRYLSDVMPPNCFPVVSSPANIRKYLQEADLVVGAVLIPGATAPRLVTRDMLKLMKKGTVMVDVTHDDPIYEIDGIIHYCVANMPGAVSMTSTIALTNATLPYAIEIAEKGVKRAAQDNPEIAQGINIIDGKVTYPGVAEAFGLKYTPIEKVLGQKQRN
jgi:alanine dehydrogenase